MQRGQVWVLTDNLSSLSWCNDIVHFFDLEVACNLLSLSWLSRQSQQMVRIQLRWWDARKKRGGVRHFCWCTSHQQKYPKHFVAFQLSVQLRCQSVWHPIGKICHCASPSLHRGQRVTDIPTSSQLWGISCPAQGHCGEMNGALNPDLLLPNGLS